MPPRPVKLIEWTVAGGCAAWAAARAAAADRLPYADGQAVAALSFTPQATGAAWLAALALRRRSPGPAAVAALSAGVLSALVMPRAIARVQPPARGPVLRVLTANLLVGRAPAEPVVSLVRQLDPDVFFAQEVTPRAAVALRSAGLRSLLPYAAGDSDAADPRGNVIYARYPLSECPSVPRKSPAQPAVTMSFPAQVRLACVHLRTPRTRAGQEGVHAWRSELRALPAPGAADAPPLILAGDFNATLDHAEFRRVLRGGYADAACQVGRGLMPTWGPGADRRGQLTIDHVLADPRCAIMQVSVHSLPGTDHRAVFAELRLP